MQHHDAIMHWHQVRDVGYNIEQVATEQIHGKAVHCISELGEPMERRHKLSRIYQEYQYCSLCEDLMIL